MGEELAQLRPGFEELGLGSARRDAEIARDLLVGESFDVVQHEHSTCARRELVHRLLDRLGEEGALGVHLDRGTVLLDLRLETRQAATLSQRIHRAIDGDPVRPRSELRIPTIARQRAEDLNPDLLGDVSGQVLVVPDQSPNDEIDMRGVARPQRPQRALITFYGSTNREKLDCHGELVTQSKKKGCQGRGY